MEGDIAGFCEEIETAITNCIEDAAPKMARKYGLPAAGAVSAMPRLFIKAGVKRALRDRGMDDDEIENVVQHFYMFLNGAQLWAEDRQ